MARVVARISQKDVQDGKGVTVCRLCFLLADFLGQVYFIVIRFVDRCVPSESEKKLQLIVFTKLN